jgi:L-fuculose-phosphate aldolase
MKRESMPLEESMNPIWSDIIERVCWTAKHMASLGLVVGSGGNVSARIPGEALAAITPARIPYERLVPDDIVLVDLDGTVVEGRHPASSETPMHTLVYKRLPAAGAIVHTQSPYATAFAVLREGIPLICTEGFAVNALQVEVAGFHVPGSVELGMEAVAALERQPGSRAVLLANHGVLAVGANLEQAFSVAENVEREAQIYYLARSLGTPHIINADDYERVKKHYAALRKQAGAAG